MRSTKILVVILLCVLTGCAQLQHAIEVTPQRAEDAFTDPVRRTHILWQVGHLASTGAVTVGCYVSLAPTIVGMLACPLVGVLWNYLTYEYVLEPWAKSRVQEGEPSTFGPYWERGPQDGEEFSNE